MFEGVFSMTTPTSSQQMIIDQVGNIAVSASAGTGKTFTLISKIEKELETYKGHKKIAAITFTIKATNEIKERLQLKTLGHFIGTNNSFVIDEIIQPFMRDIYGMEFQKEMQADYNERFNTFEEGIAYIRNRGIIGTYNETKSNFIFKLARHILKNSKACQLYLKAKYMHIYIDEYQDCDTDMHQFFMLIVDLLRIPLFVVGDIKQSIYNWRGAHPEHFAGLKDRDDFTHIPLQENHRSCLQIQNYSNLLNSETAELFQPIKELEDIYYLDNDEAWEEKLTQLLDREKTIALLRYKNVDAEQQANSLKEYIEDVVFLPALPIAEIANGHSWLIYAVCQYCVLDKYSIYHLWEEIPNELLSFSLNKQVVKNKLEAIKQAIQEKSCFMDKVRELFSIFEYKIKNSEVEKMWESVSDEKYYNSYTPENFRHIAITLHSSKGLEFDQVIVFTEDFPLNNQDSVAHHYVAVTRAKKKLFIVNKKECWKSRKFNDNLTRKISPHKLEDLVTYLYS